jgi:hypothetical protein
VYVLSWRYAMSACNVLIHDKGLARHLRLAIANDLIHDGPYDVDAKVKEIQAAALQAHQFASTHRSQSKADNHRSFPKL